MSGNIYFVTDGEALKIGYAKNLRERIRLLQVSHHFPLYLVGAIRGTKDDERVLHHRFSAFRLRGEWFKIDQKITDAIHGFDAAGLIVDSDDFDDWKARIPVGDNANFR